MKMNTREEMKRCGALKMIGILTFLLCIETSVAMQDDRNESGGAPLLDGANAHVPGSEERLPSRKTTGAAQRLGGMLDAATQQGGKTSKPEDDALQAPKQQQGGKTSKPEDFEVAPRKFTDTTFDALAGAPGDDAGAPANAQNKLNVWAWLKANPLLTFRMTTLMSSAGIFSIIVKNIADNGSSVWWLFPAMGLCIALAFIHSWKKENTTGDFLLTTVLALSTGAVVSFTTMTAIPGIMNAINGNTLAAVAPFWACFALGMSGFIMVMTLLKMHKVDNKHILTTAGVLALGAMVGGAFLFVDQGLYEISTLSNAFKNTDATLTIVMLGLGLFILYAALLGGGSCKAANRTQVVGSVTLLLSAGIMTGGVFTMIDAGGITNASGTFGITLLLVGLGVFAICGAIMLVVSAKVGCLNRTISKCFKTNAYMAVGNHV